MLRNWVQVILQTFWVSPLRPVEWLFSGDVIVTKTVQERFCNDYHEQLGLDECSTFQRWFFLGVVQNLGTNWRMVPSWYVLIYKQLWSVAPFSCKSNQKRIHRATSVPVQLTFTQCKVIVICKLLISDRWIHTWFNINVYTPMHMPLHFFCTFYVFVVQVLSAMGER